MSFIQILTRTDAAAFTLQVVLNNLKEECDKPDIEVIVKGGGLRITFLNWFVANMLVNILLLM